MRTVYWLKNIVNLKKNTLWNISGQKVREFFNTTYHHCRCVNSAQNTLMWDNIKLSVVAHNL